jgi:hypothetical protein
MAFVWNAVLGEEEWLRLDPGPGGLLSGVRATDSAGRSWYFPAVRVVGTAPAGRLTWHDAGVPAGPPVRGVRFVRVRGAVFVQAVSAGPFRPVE